ncbi:hypothetical protein IKG05_01460 [Candidatus Saccharibacteria bacterium]|nr:hypothetical protein [Candidatus Saccharibacteria bacterium]
MKETNKKIKIGIIAALLAFGLIIVVAVVSVLTASKKLDLYNIDQVNSGLTSSEVRDLEKFIWESLQRTQGASEDVGGVVALVRPSSFVVTDKDGVRNYSFLVDVDKYQATYRVSFALMGSEGFYESPVLDCPLPEQMKYAGTDCKSDKTSAMSVTVGRYLPYTFSLDSGEIVTVTRKTNEVGAEYLNVRVSSCGDEEVKVNAKTAVEKWIDALGYKVINYTVEVPDFCDGGI